MGLAHCDRWLAARSANSRPQVQMTGGRLARMSADVARHAPGGSSGSPRFGPTASRASRHSSSVGALHGTRSIGGGSRRVAACITGSAAT